MTADFSEKALAWLAESDFKQGIVAGVMENVAVAHKFGERSFPNVNSVPPSTVNELHDCGVVYAKDHPYFLCVMTKGKNFNSLAEAIKKVSFTVFEEVKNNYK